MLMAAWHCDPKDQGPFHPDFLVMENTAQNVSGFFEICHDSSRCVWTVHNLSIVLEIGLYIPKSVLKYITYSRGRHLRTFLVCCEIWPHAFLVCCNRYLCVFLWKIFGCQMLPPGRFRVFVPLPVPCRGSRVIFKKDFFLAIPPLTPLSRSY